MEMGGGSPTSRFGQIWTITWYGLGLGGKGKLGLESADGGKSGRREHFWVRQHSRRRPAGKLQEPVLKT